MKLNVILEFRTINYIKLQGIYFYIIDINVSGNQGVNMRFWELEDLTYSKIFNPDLLPNVSKFLFELLYSDQIIF